MAVLAQEAEVVETVVVAALDMVDVVAGPAADDAGAMVSPNHLGSDLSPVLGHLLPAAMVSVSTGPGHGVLLRDV